MDPISHLLGAWSAELNLFSVLLRVGLSLVLAAVIGWERSSKRHSAGFRTFILISLGMTFAMLTDLFLIEKTGAGFYFLSGAAIIGIATITVNSILFSSRNQIKGLTTSVGLWAVGLLGMTAGAGFYTVTLVAFVAILLSLAVFPEIETYLKNRSNHFEIHLELQNSAALQDFIATIRKLGIVIDDIELNPAYIHSGLSVYTIALSIRSGELKKYKTHNEIIEALSTIEYIYHIEEIRT